MNENRSQPPETVTIKKKKWVLENALDTEVVEEGRVGLDRSRHLALAGGVAGGGEDIVGIPGLWEVGQGPSGGGLAVRAGAVVVGLVVAVG